MISKKTADDILEIISYHTAKGDTQQLLEDLSKVEGNESFRISMKLLLYRFKGGDWL